MNHHNPARPEAMQVTEDEIERVRGLAAHHFEAANIAIARNCREEFDAACRRAWDAGHEQELAFPDLVLEDIGLPTKVADSLEREYGVVTVADLLRCKPELVLAMRRTAATSLVGIYCTLASAAIQRLSKWEKTT